MKPSMIFALLAAMSTGATLAGPVLAEGGELLVGNKSADTVWRLSLADGRKLGEVESGQGPHEIVVAADAGVAVVSDYGRDRPGNSLTVIDLGAGHTTRSIDLGAHPRPHGMRFLPGGRRLLATTEDSAALLLVDVDAGKVERAIDIGDGKGHMVALSADASVAYVSKLGAGTVVRIDVGEAKKTHEVPAGKGAEGIAVAADGSVWVSNRDDGTVTVHDPDTLAILATLDSPGFPIRVAFTADGAHALVTNARAATLAVFDARARTPVATVALAPQGVEFQETMLGRAALPIGAIADPAGGRVFVAVSGADRIAVVDTGSWKVEAYWDTGQEPDALAIVPAKAGPAAD